MSKLIYYPDKKFPDIRDITSEMNGKSFS